MTLIINRSMPSGRRQDDEILQRDQAPDSSDKDGVEICAQGSDTPPRKDPEIEAGNERTGRCLEALPSYVTAIGTPGTLRCSGMGRRTQPYCLFW